MMTDGAWYALPDNTRVQAFETSSGWRLQSDAGPLYLFTDGRWYSLRYDPAIDGFAVVPCDLTDADLRALP